MIAKECTPKLYNDIFDGPKYLTPLIESISLYSLICFLNDPEKLLHRELFFDNSFVSLNVIHE